MVSARVTLYDRLYYHHKVRAAEGMIANLIELVATSDPLSLSELFQGFSDDTMVDVWGGRLTASSLRSGGPRALDLARRARARELFHRAYSFSARFIAGLDGLPDQDRKDTKALTWSEVTGALEDHEGRRVLALEICAKAVELAKSITRFHGLQELLHPSEIVVDLPSHKRVAKGGDILTTSEQGHVGTPNLFFNAEKWVDAYSQQKHCGHVYAPRRLMILVALASRIVFYERFGLVMGQEADIAAKTPGIITGGLYDELSKKSLCSAECLAMLREAKPRLVRVRPEDLRVPDALAREDPELANRLATNFAKALPEGLPASVHERVTHGVAAMLVVLQTIEQGGEFVKSSRPDEVRGLQPRIRDFLRAQGLKVDEGSELGGGETDLVLSDAIVLENKVLGSTPDPFTGLEPAGWQARRYAVALSQRVRFIVAAYKPSTEAALLVLSQRVRVRSAVNGTRDRAVEVQFVVPYACDVPSHAGKRAKAAGETEPVQR